jgi:secreted protein with Ig-like and vWFA domain
MLPLTFALLGVTFAAWTLLAYALSAFLGALLRRTIPAMVLTLVIYIVLAMQTATAIRPHYAAPVTVPSSSAAANNGWVISIFAKSAAGQEISQQGLYATFQQQAPASVQNSKDPNAFQTWVTQHGYTQWTTVQPDSRFWEFQLIEGAWLTAVSTALIGGSAWLIRRRGA